MALKTLLNPNLLLFSKINDLMVALVRIALTTHTFSGYCSTTELQGQLIAPGDTASF
tara:strand:+ start:536 stop:706 length:171 start_codon:yes stop_codon:yes gene_type:complete